MKKLLVALLVILSTSAMAQQKLGHVNSQELLDTMPSRKAALATLQQFEKDGYAELTEMETGLQEAYQLYMGKQSTLSPIMIEIEEEKLKKKQTALQEREQSLQREMQAISKSMNDPILERIQEAVKIVAERKKISYVIDETTTLYFDNGIDLTAEVMKELLRLDAEAMKQ